MLSIFISFFQLFVVKVRDAASISSLLLPHVSAALTFVMDSLTAEMALMKQIVQVYIVLL